MYASKFEPTDFYLLTNRTWSWKSDFFGNHLSSCVTCSILSGCAYGLKGMVKAPIHLHTYKTNKWLWINHSRFGANENDNRCTIAWFCTQEPQTDPPPPPRVIPFRFCSACVFAITLSMRQYLGSTRMEHIPVVAWRSAVTSRYQLLHSERRTGL